MKTFSDKLNENTKPYEDKDIRSVIYSIIENKLTLSNTDKSLSITGKEELTEKILSLLQIENINETIDTYKEVYENPVILQECDVTKKKVIKSEEPEDLEQDEKIEKNEDQEK